VTDSAVSSLRDAYLTLLKRAVLGETVPPTIMYRPVHHVPGGRFRRGFLARALRQEGAVLARQVAVDISQNDEGRLSAWDLPPWPLTMIGARRLANVEQCMQSVLEAGVPGDFIETGVWKGGTTIFMRGFLRAHDVTDRKVYVADSFQGLPEPDLTQYPADQGLDLHLWPNLSISLDEVRANFARFGLLDRQVEFVEGWFRDTLPPLRGHSWSVIRLDADMYESTIDALRNLYDGLAPGGWLIIDDYQDIPACRRAVDDFRDERSIEEPIVTVDWSAVCWQKQP
jgi:Macrocin-O-methyltransferase (TylF)